ncbi:imidazole glycerol phosphate synthase subunit HisH [Jiulongibacter sediminis]|uniref:Imidazole glycerol phosphate synthase n=1 Tax=Jiulongibacter sediminis TaxID=1605367 RepID=A0A0P7C6P3_9BACT|nr:imidazole glycerol phosphate synthase subunit HisH [Jiulongibacter sediminis]KPM48019.1 imidazole glycerol phosphate synthase [Jiulongibacter sediminis]TBX24201.1 imidazole glycerol phosphate synthase [Jiulongibacter sediminis]
MPEITIIKYNAGNVMSVMYALDRIGVSYQLTDKIEDIQSAEKIIFPGVGEASTAMKSLRDNGLDKVIPDLKQPFLGTCVGMQLLCKHSEEGDVNCLGVFDIPIVKFPKKEGFKIPQTGWNSISDFKSELLNGVRDGDYVYYNHSFYAPISAETVATTDYILPYSGMLQKDNFYACQFHSEISGDVGEQIFKNFVKL